MIGIYKIKTTDDSFNVVIIEYEKIHITQLNDEELKYLFDDVGICFATPVMNNYYYINMDFDAEFKTSEIAEVYNMVKNSLLHLLRQEKLNYLLNT